MKEAKYTRIGHIITNIETGERKAFVHNGYPSINKAKKESHKIQMREDGALGRGTLRLAS